MAKVCECLCGREREKETDGDSEEEDMAKHQIKDTQKRKRENRKV